jgi:hypothetical protein
MSEQYVWFDGVRIASDGNVSLYCVMNGLKVPLPIGILHPDCTLRKPGDVGKLGVLLAWAVGWGLVPQRASNRSHSDRISD